MAPSTVVPESFARAVEALQAASPRPEIVLEDLAPPQRLAPHAYALGGTVGRGGEEVATGRLVLLYDPEEEESWDGVFRLVTYVTAEVETELAIDPLLPAVGWSWLTDALETEGARYTAIAGTVTQTISTRFGEIAGPPSAADLEIRASWTPLDEDVSIHLNAWCALLASTAGLPPPGVTAIPDRLAARGA
jgi:hypothetical protein